MRDHKIVFNLSIKDLKDLGIIKKRKKKKKRLSKYYKNIIPSNIKSSSDHMVGSYSNLFNNTSNLQTENLRLQNKNLIDNSETNKTKLLELENNLTNLHNVTSNDLFNFFGNSLDRFERKQIANQALSNIPSAYINGSGPRIEELDDSSSGYAVNDGIDISSTKGDTVFQSMQSKEDRLREVPAIPYGLPTAPPPPTTPPSTPPSTPSTPTSPTDSKAYGFSQTTPSLLESPLMTFPEVYGDITPEKQGTNPMEKGFVQQKVSKIESKEAQPKEDTREHTASKTKSSSATITTDTTESTKQAKKQHKSVEQQVRERQSYDKERNLKMAELRGILINKYNIIEIGDKKVDKITSIELLVDKIKDLQKKDTDLDTEEKQAIQNTLKKLNKK